METQLTIIGVIIISVLVLLNIKKTFFEKKN